jgi:glucosylceramidase
MILINQRNFTLLVLLIFLISCKDVKKNEEKKPEIAKSDTANIDISSNGYSNKTLQIYTTAKETELKLTKTSEQKFKNKEQALETEIAVFVNPEKTFQEFLGIGGAITDASSEVFSTLDKTKQNQLLQSLYGEGGIGYNIIRTSIHSSDFGLGSHTYIEEGDAELKTFSIEKDKEKRILNKKSLQCQCT